jgi:hypothetical protein
VTGLGSKKFTSDLITWSEAFQNNFELKSAYDALAIDRKVISDYLLSKGVKQNEMVFLRLIFRNNSEAIRIPTGIISRENFQDII